MMRNRTISIGVALAVLISLGCSADARAQSLWNIAGTFNDWATDDPDWTMSPVRLSKPDGMLSIEHFLDVGMFSFKFVRDGAWENGHFGAGERRGYVAEPGEDIRLRIDAPGIYTIYLDPGRGIWRSKVTQLDEPALIVRILGVPQMLSYMTIDFGRSVAVGGVDGSKMSLDIGSAPIRVTAADHGAPEYLLRPEKVGRWTVTLTLRSRGAVVKQDLELNVVPFMQTRWLARDGGRIPDQALFEPQEEGVFRAFIDILEPASLLSLQVEVGDEIPAKQNDLEIAAGSYVVEIVEGQLTRQDDPDLPSFLLGGNWRRFVHVPEGPADRVHLIGDFNDWAGPDELGAIELFPQWDGTYTQIVNLPDGRHRYQFLIDGMFKEHDRANDQTTRGDEGELMSMTVVGMAPDDSPQPAP